MNTDHPAHRPFFYERYTAFHHLRAAFWQGAVWGIFLLNEYIARKSLGATRWHILAMLLVPAIAQFVTVVWNPTDPRRLLGKRPFIDLGITVQLLLLLFLVLPFLHRATAFVAVIAACQAAAALLIPAQNMTLALNYGEATRGRRFANAVSIQAAVIIAVSLPAGYVLDHNVRSWPWLYALAAMAAIYGYLHWSRLRRRRGTPPPERAHVHRSPWEALRNDRAFLAFEACFMVYGFGFLMLMPVLPIYLVDELRITYAQVSLSRGLLYWLAIVVVCPLLGRLADHAGILRVGALAFAVLSAFPLALLTVKGMAGVYLGFAIFGVGMGGVTVAWNMGPVAMARGRDPLPYLNAHVALVGVRALIGMVTGTYLQYVLGSRTVFWCVAALEITAATGLYITARATGRRWVIPKRDA